MAYTPHSDADIKAMLETIGAESTESLFDCIPPSLRAKELNLDAGLSEYETLEKVAAIGRKNQSDLLCFMGGGYYDHVIPSAIDALSSRAEFYTAYTPYQPEASQGTLQALYEYQSMILSLTGMEITNASMYDGGTAMAEAALMALRITKKRNKIVLDAGVHPYYKEIVRTYLAFHGTEIVEIGLKKDAPDMDALKAALDENVSSYIFQNPNFFGSVHDYTEIVDAVHAVGAQVIGGIYPLSLGLLKTPAKMGVDIVCGDGQSLGNPLNFGGPYFGILATTNADMRQIPGRICGRTVDKDGKEAYVLTLQAREQHIRRHRAMSNICSNQNLCALRASMYLSLLGKEGIAEVAETVFQKSEYLKSELQSIDGVSVWNESPTFNEFVITLPGDARAVYKTMKEKDFAAGILLGQAGFENALMVSVTEKRTRDQMDAYVTALKELL